MIGEQNQNQRFFLDCIKPKNQNKEIDVRCMSANPAKFICLKKQCQRYQQIVCGLSQCECQKNHNSCTKMGVQSYINCFSQKILKQKKKLLSDRFQQIINRLIKTKQSLFAVLQKQVEEFYSYLKDITQLYTQQQKQLPNKIPLIQKVNISLRKQVDQTFQRLGQFIKKNEDKLNQSIQTLNKEINHFGQKRNQQRQFKSFCGQLRLKQIQLDTSSIVKTVQYGMRVLNFFNKPIKKMKLLFKASQHDFKVIKFYQLYEQENNLLFICQSFTGHYQTAQQQLNRVFGAYTPLSFCRDGPKQQDDYGNFYREDPSGESFLFSLTNNDKFDLIQKDKAISYREQENNIIFGEWQLVIMDNLNKTGSWLSFNQAYYNSNYDFQDQDSIKKLYGSRGCCFKQWEVWKVELTQ